jgi:ribonuclease P protein component
MPKQNRISGAQIRAISGARRISGDFFSLSLSPSITGAVQCACVVSKKVSKLAVKRNLIRRRTRAALQNHLSALKPGVYIFHAKRESVKAPYTDIKADIEKITAKIR